MRIDKPDLTHVSGNEYARRVLLSTTVLSATATVDLTLPQEYSNFQVMITELIPATDDVQLTLQISVDGSTFLSDANYDYTMLNSTTTSSARVSGTSATSITMSSTTAATGLGSSANEMANFEINLYNANNSNIFFEVHGVAANIDASARVTKCEFSGRYNVAATVARAIRLAASSGNLTSGEVRLYGII